MPFDEYVEKSVATSQDLGNLYAGIRYLRYLDGEKHLVFLTPGGLFLPRLENSSSIAALANDARATVDIIHTGGMAGGAPQRPMPPQINGRGAAAITMNSAMPSPSMMFNQTFSVGSSKQVAELTGGLMGAFRGGRQAVQASRRDYARAVPARLYADECQLGRRLPEDPGVGESRRAVSALADGYAARQEVKPLNRKEYLTYSRIASAINRPQPIDDLRVTLGPPTIPGPKTMHVNVHLSAEGVTFTRDGELHAAQIECAYFIGNARQGLAGEVWRTLDFKLTEPNYQKFLREGVSYTQAVAFEGEPKYVKVVVYQYESDLVGSALVTIKK